ncbi:MAG: SLC13 family permease [Akkermansia sp.]|nr:SLC13 family permease [Akkermansia sp.]MBR2314401.1 SLC13 family permease [Akkermansia sp.]
MAFLPPCGPDAQAWITLLTAAGIFALLLCTRLQAELVFLGGMAVLLVSGVVDAREALAGFSSPSVIVVALLFVVVAGLVHTGVLHWVEKHLLGRPQSYREALVRLMLPVAGMASILGNTTVTTLFIHVVKLWSRRLRVAPSRLLIPLSYAAGLGGVCTLIGSAPNLIISGLYTQETGVTLSIFTPTLAGLFCLTVGLASMQLLQSWLPERRPSRRVFGPGAGMLHRHTAYVRFGSRLIGKRFADTGLEAQYCIHLAGIVRRGEQLLTAPGHVQLRAGDALLLESDSSRPPDLGKDVHYITRREKSPIGWRTAASGSIMLGMMLLSTLGIFTLLQAAFLAAAATLICRCCTVQQAHSHINWNVLMVFAGSICLGTAMDKTGVAAHAATLLLSLCGTQPLVMLAAVCAVALFITEFIGNAAAAAIFFPIAYRSALAVGADPLSFCVALMIAVSCCFATPIGSPRHMLIYGPGGYRFADFLRVGLPMDIIILAADIFIVSLLFPLQIQ